jgi:nicotinamidase-related amidase
MSISKTNTILLLQDLHAPFADVSNGLLIKKAKAKVIMREFEEYVELVNQMTPNIPLMLNACREIGIPVIYSCLGIKGKEKLPPLLDAFGWDWDLQGPLGKFDPDWEPMDKEPVFVRGGWSALTNIEFLGLLENAKIANVLVMGTLLEYGIRQTTVELGDMDISSLIISDGTAALTRFSQDFTSDSIAHGLIKLRSTGEVLDILDRCKRESSVLV